jgi:hypothetical protein
MKNRKWIMAVTAMLLVVLCLLAGCQTTIPVSYTEPARLNLSGVSRIAIDSDDSQAAATVSQRLAAAGKYTVAPAAELSAWKQWKADRQAMEALADYQGRAAEISSGDLVRAYTGNAVRADSAYLNHLLKITALVKEIGKSTQESYFVRLEGAGNDSVDVFFAGSEISALAAVDKGQTITVIGECRGYNPPDMEDTAEILRILGAGRSIKITNATFPVDVVLKDYPGTVDAVIVLNSTFSTEDSSHTNRRAAVDGNGKTIVDSAGKTVYRDVTIYDRKVTVNVGYQIVRLRDSFLIGEGTKSAASESSDEDRSQLPDPAGLAARAVNQPLNEFMSEILPTERSASITLAKETDNKEAKKEMGAAERLAKANNYAEAAAAYGKIYAAYKNFAAGYNQAVLTEAAAGTEAAIVLMEVLSRETGNSTARSALADMQRRNAGNQMAAAQLSQ